MEQNTEAEAGAKILDGIIEETDYCRARGISLRTAQRERRMRKGPPHIRLGKKIYYRVSSVREWLEAQETSSATRGGRR